MRKKQPKKKRSRKPKLIEEKEELDKSKPKPIGTWHKKESTYASSWPDPTNISEENKEREFMYKEDEPLCKEEQP